MVWVRRHPSDSVDEQCSSPGGSAQHPAEILGKDSVTVRRELQGRLCCWASGDKRIHCSNHLPARGCLTAWRGSTATCPHNLSFSINICHSLLLLHSWRPSGDKKLLSLTSLPHLASTTHAFLADLQFLLQISPRKAILIAVLLQAMQFSCLQEFPHVHPIFYLTWNLHPALCWVSAGECGCGQTDVRAVSSLAPTEDLCRDYCIPILHQVN